MMVLMTGGLAGQHSLRTKQAFLKDPYFVELVAEQSAINPFFTYPISSGGSIEEIYEYDRFF